MKIRKLMPGDLVPQKGDLLLVQGVITGVRAYKVAETKNADGQLQVIFRKRGNIGFNYDRYLAGNSWVKDCRRVTAK